MQPRHLLSIKRHLRTVRYQLPNLFFRRRMFYMLRSNVPGTRRKSGPMPTLLRSQQLMRNLHHSNQVQLMFQWILSIKRSDLFALLQSRTKLPILLSKWHQFPVPHLYLSLQSHQRILRIRPNKYHFAYPRRSSSNSTQLINHSITYHQHSTSE